VIVNSAGGPEIPAVLDKIKLKNDLIYPDYSSAVDVAQYGSKGRR
jgi:hypothetical protein